MSGKPKCPRCQTDRSVYLKGLGAGIYPASYVCYNCDVYGHLFNEDDEGVDVEACRKFAGSMVDLSRANAAASRLR